MCTEHNVPMRTDSDKQWKGEPGMKLVKLRMCSEVWLVPPGLGGAAFMSARNKLILAPDGGEVDWTEEEEKAFSLVQTHPDVWRPL